MQSSEIRAKARQSLNGSWGVAIAAAAIACLLGGLIVGASFLPKTEWRQQIDTIQSEGFTAMLYGAGAAFGALASLGGLLSFAQFIIGGVIELGYAKFLLKQNAGQPLDVGDLFSEFDRFGTGFAQKFLRSLYIALWSLLLVIPGIMAGYSYAMTPYILAEHPDLTASQAIQMSKSMMFGHRWDLFVLDLSFIGWSLLAAITMNLGYLALNPYTNAAHTVFYKNLTAKGYQEPIF